MKPHITLSSDLEQMFGWLTRAGVGRKFGSLPIGWYQMHQCNAIDYLGELVRSAGGNDHSPLRVRLGHVQAQINARWITLCSTIEAFQQADNRTRK